MKSWSPELKAHFAQEYINPATCWKLTLTNSTVNGFTSHDLDLVISGVTYLAASGFDATSVETSNALNVDNLEITGILQTPAITEADLHAGLYDYAKLKVFEVNWSDLTQGSYSLRDGIVGQVTTERDKFIAEIQGLMDALKRSIGELCNPACPYNLGDLPFPAPFRGRCTKDLTTFTKTGTLAGVSADGMTLFDPARTEPGPVGGVAITGISNANPGRVSTAADPGIPDFGVGIISGVVGPTALNTTVVVRNPDATGFDLSIDTSDTGAYPPYVSGGTVTPLGGDSGYFDYGTCKITSGANDGLLREVKSYIPGQWTLQDRFPYPLAGTETYTMVAGCNKTSTTCKGKFANLDNFGGFPFVPGQDKAIQVAQPQSTQSQSKK